MSLENAILALAEAINNHADAIRSTGLAEAPRSAAAKANVGDTVNRNTGDAAGLLGEGSIHIRGARRQ